MAQAAKTERLRSLFTQAFEASPRFKVLNDSDQSKAELVIGLRFEAAERASGFVFVDIRDSNGKFIWRDFANCMESRPNETFIIDARGLVISGRNDEFFQITKAKLTYRANVIDSPLGLADPRASNTTPQVLSCETVRIETPFNSENSVWVEVEISRDVRWPVGPRGLS